MNRGREPLCFGQVGGRRLAPDEVGIRRVGESSRDRRLDSVTDAEEPLGRSLTRAELAIELVDVACEERGREGVGARHDQRRDVENVGGEAGSDECPDELARRHQHFTAEMTALLLGGQLVLEMDGGRAGLDVSLHDLERI